MLELIQKWFNKILSRIKKLFGDRRLEKETIITLTESLNDHLYYELEKEGKLDSQIRKHIIYIANDSLHKIKDYELTYEELEEFFNNFRRLYLVIQRYKKDRRGADRDKIISILKEVKKTV